jgi:hypothetical protein
VGYRGGGGSTLRVGATGQTMGTVEYLDGQRSSRVLLASCVLSYNMAAGLEWPQIHLDPPCVQWLDLVFQ